jgi:hypothetical protein
MADIIGLGRIRITHLNSQKYPLKVEGEDQFVANVGTISQFLKVASQFCEETARERREASACLPGIICIYSTSSF